MSGSATGTYTKNKVVCTEIDQLAKLGYFDFISVHTNHDNVCMFLVSAQG